MIQIDRLDHLVLTVRDIHETCAFYTAVLGMRVEQFGDGRIALRFGQQKINLHEAGREFEPKAGRPTAGSADLCFLTTTRPEQAIEHLQACGIDVIEGPVPRAGAAGPIDSLYFRDPDANLIELGHLRPRLD
jgi:catechol 2,3-dioxygenase-like lactoylglutathione lyase family enzyme